MFIHKKQTFLVFELLAIYEKSFIFDVSLGSKYTPGFGYIFTTVIGKHVTKFLFSKRLLRTV